MDIQHFKTVPLGYVGPEAFFLEIDLPASSATQYICSLCGSVVHYYGTALHEEFHARVGY